jgi:hypothetical protein
MPFRKPASGLCPEPRRGRNRGLRPFGPWRAPRGAARQFCHGPAAPQPSSTSASAARSASASRAPGVRLRKCVLRSARFSHLAHFCQVCASCDVGLGAGLWHGAPEALSAGQEGFGSCQPPSGRAARLEQSPLKLLNIFAEAGSMFCWHRWRVIQVSPRSAYEKCMRCGRHRHVNAPEGGSARPTGRRSRLFPPF